MKTYIAYLRQSTMKQQISGLGVEAQREIIHNHVKNKPILAEYIETESGKKSNRPQLLAALAMCRKTNSILIVAKLDRLSRNVAFTSKLLESDVEIVFCDFPQANRLILHIISSIAEYEAGLISQRTKQLSLIHIFSYFTPKSDFVLPSIHNRKSLFSWFNIRQHNSEN